MLKKKKKKTNVANGAAGPPQSLPDVPGVTVPVEVEADAVEPTHNPRRKLSPSEIRRLTGLSQQRISQRRIRGETGEEIILSVEARKAAEREALREERAHHRRTGGKVPAPLSYSVRRKAQADAEMKQIELAVRRGELMPTSVFMQSVSTAYTNARLVFEQIEELGDSFAYETDAVKIRYRIRDEVTRGLYAIADALKLTDPALAARLPGLELPPEVRQAIGIVSEYVRSEFAKTEMGRQLSAGGDQ